MLNLIDKRKEALARSLYMQQEYLKRWYPACTSHLLQSHRPTSPATLVLSFSSKLSVLFYDLIQTLRYSISFHKRTFRFNIM